MAHDVLIIGLGIAGPAVAHWLLQYGITPTLVERAASARDEGYVIDFWGAGYDIAEKMGLLPQVRDAGYQVREVRIVGRDGRRGGGFDANVFREATFGRFTSLPRGALSEILYRSVRDRAEVRFSESITRLDDDGSGVEVTFERAPRRRFDLVIGADGLHSVVRAHTFGAESQFENFLGYTVAAYEIPGYRPRDEDVYVTYSTPGHQVARFAMRGDRTMVLFIAVDPGAPDFSARGLAENKAHLHREFDSLGWECPQLLAGLDACEKLYIDRVSQIRMPQWSKGRVVLVGDAACAPSLLAGQGSALALIGAYVLAGELSLPGTPEEAFTRYESRLREFMTHKQDAAVGFAHAFAPLTRWGVFVRNQVTRLLWLPFVSRRVMGKGLLDRIELPAYGVKAAA